MVLFLSVLPFFGSDSNSGIFLAGFSQKIFTTQNPEEPVILTDCIDVAYNELRGLILDNIKSNEIIIEPIVPVASFLIINGNFVLRLKAEAYSENTAFSVILNPSKERPARLIGKTRKKAFILWGRTLVF